MDEFMKSLSELNLQQVEERLSQLETEVRSATDIKDVEERTEQKKALLVRQGELKELEKRKKMALDMTEGKVEGKIIEERGLDKGMEKYGIDSKEYRSAFLNNIRGLDLNDIEKRAFTSVNDSAGATIPTQTSNEIITKIKQIAPLLGEVTLLNVEGNVTFAVEGEKADASKHGENATITATEDSLIPVTLTSYEISKLVQVSKTVKTMSIDAFENWLTDMIAEKVAEKIGVYLINGTGTNEPQGIDKAATWNDTNSVTVAASGTTSANVQKLIGLLPGTYDKNAKFLMSKKTLFTEYMPLQDNSKNKIVTQEGHSYYVYGYPVMLDDNIAIGEAYLGDFKKIVANLSEAINVVSEFDIRTNSYLYLGTAMFDSKIAVGEAFVKMVKATA